MTDDFEARAPLGLVLLTGLYLFFFIVTVTTFGNPYPFLGRIYVGMAAKILIFVDSLICLYLFLGILKKQLLTWYFVIGYNLFEIVNTVVNLYFIAPAEIERVIGEQVDREALLINNIASALAIMLLTQYIFRHKHYFTNRKKYLF